MSGAPGFWRRFAPVWLAGVLGLASLLLQPVPEQLAQATQLQQLPGAALRVLMLVNPLVLVTLLAVLGAAAAHRVGLGSRLAGTSPVEPRAWVLQSVVTGLALGIAITALDRLLLPVLGPAWQEVVQRSGAVSSWRSLLFGMAYGGVVEEVMLRWGVMSGLAWLLARALGLRAATFVVAALVAALLFGAGHLPALAQEIALTPAIVARTVALNTVAGFAYGLLFWKRGLEAAMLAHAATHVGFAIVRAVA